MMSTVTKEPASEAHAAPIIPTSGIKSTFITTLTTAPAATMSGRRQVSPWR